MSDRRNLYIRAAEGDEEAERVVLAELRRKHEPEEEVVNVGLLGVSRGLMQVSVPRAGRLLARALDGDDESRQHLASLLECPPVAGRQLATGFIDMDDPTWRESGSVEFDAPFGRVMARVDSTQWLGRVGVTVWQDLGPVLVRPMGQSDD